jgi:riboflavin synthase
MFTGIIREVGIVKQLHDGKLEIGNWGENFPSIGSSVSVNGVCLTVAGYGIGAVIFDVMPETLRKTTIGGKNAGDAVNLESSLRVGDELGGHFVCGHADGVGVVTNVEKEHDAALMTIQPPQELMRFFAPQGSVAVDGVSLTIADTRDDAITVSLVQHTLEHTTLGRVKKGDRVNIECDMLAKYALNHFTT